MWLWGREIEDYVGDKTRGVRAKAAEGMRAVGERTGRVLDHGGNSLRRAEELWQTKSITEQEYEQAKYKQPQIGTAHVLPGLRNIDIQPAKDE